MDILEWEWGGPFWINVRWPILHDNEVPFCMRADCVWHDNEVALFCMTVRWHFCMTARWPLFYTNYDTDDLQNSLSKLNASSFSTKIRSFQFRLLHRIHGINANLHKWGIVQSKMCVFFKNEEETYRHLFYDLNMIHTLWKEVKRHMQAWSQTFIEFNVLDILLVTPETVEPS